MKIIQSYITTVLLSLSLLWGTTLPTQVRYDPHRLSLLESKLHKIDKKIEKIQSELIIIDQEIKTDRLLAQKSTPQPQVPQVVTIQRPLSNNIPQEETEAPPKLTVKIDLSQQRMRVYKEDRLLYKWRVSTARRGYVTPVGTYQPQILERMHYSRLYHNSPMPYSIFFRGNYAIHGTSSTWRLGRRASHGCVRLHPKHAKKLYRLVERFGKSRTRIEIVY